jgi:hypothetical protein
VITPELVHEDTERCQWIMQEKMASGIVKMGKVDDAENPSDYPGKWVSAAKYKASNAYATNSAASLTVK